MIVAKTAPYVEDVPLPIFRTGASPTKVPREVHDILEQFRPDVVVFDCSGRKRSLRKAKEIGAKTVFVSNHRRKRRRGFRIARLRYTDEHWVLRPHFITDDLTRFESLKVRRLGTTAVFLGPVYPEASFRNDMPKTDYFFCCPGGGGNRLKGRQSGAVFAEAAGLVADELGMQGVLITGANFTGDLPTHARLQVHRSLPGAELVGLLSRARFALVAGGDLLAQCVCNRVPVICAPSAPDQPQRIATYSRVGLCIPTSPQELAPVAIGVRADGRLDELTKRLEAYEVENGLTVGVRRIESLADC